MTARLREIPYNYTSFSDREIEVRRQNQSAPVTALLAAAHTAVDAFERDFDATLALRRKTINRLTRITRRAMEAADAQGLARYDNDSATDADYIVVEIAKHRLGDNWMADYVAKASRGGIERVLL